MLKNNSTEKNMPDRNYLVDIFRLFFAIQIVMIHTNPFSNLKGTVSHSIISLFNQTAVPYFLFVSAYFYIGKLMEGKKVFEKQEKKLVLTYLIWSCIYYSAGFLLMVYHKADKLEYFKFLKQSLLSFFTTGSSFQLWYLVALIFCVAIVTFFYKKLNMNLFCIVSIILFLIYMISNHTDMQNYIAEICKKSITLSYIYPLVINVIRSMIYFSLTYGFICCEKFLVKIKKIHLEIGFAGVILFYGLYYYVNQGVDPIREILPFLRIILLVILMVWLLLTSHKKLNISGEFSSGAAAFSYYFHPLAALIWDIILYSFLGITISDPIRFLLTITTCLLTAYVLYKWNNKILNHLYK